MIDKTSRRDSLTEITGPFGLVLNIQIFLADRTVIKGKVRFEIRDDFETVLYDLTVGRWIWQLTERKSPYQLRG